MNKDGSNYDFGRHKAQKGRTKLNSLITTFPYDAHFDAKNSDLRQKSTFILDILHEYSNT
jgi:hypothetical protein